MKALILDYLENGKFPYSVEQPLILESSSEGDIFIGVSDVMNKINNQSPDNDYRNDEEAMDYESEKDFLNSCFYFNHCDFNSAIDKISFENGDSKKSCKEYAKKYFNIN